MGEMLVVAGSSPQVPSAPTRCEREESQDYQRERVFALEAYPSWGFGLSPAGVLIPWSLGLPGHFLSLVLEVGNARGGLPSSVGQKVIRCPNIMLLF